MNFNSKNAFYLASGFASIVTLTACQTHPTATLTQNYTPEQSQAMLTSAIKHTLFSGQDFIAEQQITLQNPPANAKDNNSPVQMKIDCQDNHDSQLIAQMQADGITKYEDATQLTPATRRQPYIAIRDTYLACIAQAEKQEAEQRETEQQEKSLDKKQKSPQDKKVNKTHTIHDSDTLDDTSYLQDVLDTSIPKQLSASQVQSFNSLVAKSGKITYTGNYRPFAGRLAVQMDAGFDNKNLNYHYRVPAVFDLKAQALYVKPDIIMPMTALYLDNQMGMTWQDKWYKFTPSADKQLPTKLMVKSWLMAIKDSFLTLPASQFTQVQADTLASQLTAKMHNLSQPVTANAPIVHWQQTASEQTVFYQTVVNKFIARVDNELQTDSAFLALSAKQKDSQLKKWQDYKQRLSDYANRLTNAQANNSQTGLEKKPKLTGQDVYFVLDNSQLKQVYAQQNATMFDQPVAMATWLTFNPAEKTFTEAVQPATLAKLASTIKDDGTPASNVIDGVAEFKRIEALDDSRRLFGQEPDMLKSYKSYKEKAEEKRKSQTKWEFKPVDEKTLPKKQRF